MEAVYVARPDSCIAGHGDGNGDGSEQEEGVDDGDDDDDAIDDDNGGCWPLWVRP